MCWLNVSTTIIPFYGKIKDAKNKTFLPAVFIHWTTMMMVDIDDGPLMDSIFFYIVVVVVIWSCQHFFSNSRNMVGQTISFFSQTDWTWLSSSSIDFIVKQTFNFLFSIWNILFWFFLFIHTKHTANNCAYRSNRFGHKANLFDIKQHKFEIFARNIVPEQKKELTKTWNIWKEKFSILVFRKIEKINQ